MPNRGVVVQPLRAGEPVGQPFQDRAYVTPRFPDGVKRNQLRWQPLEIQLETILIWFLRNFERLRGPYFGFEEASAAPLTADSIRVTADGTQATADGSLTFDGSVSYDGTARFDGRMPGTEELEVAGFDQAPFYDGGSADKFLREELADSVDFEILADVAEGLPGQWVPKPDLAMPPAGASVDELRAALLWLLDGFDADIRELPSRDVDRWHNQPPEHLPDELLVLAPEERGEVLRVTADMRLAVASKDYRMADALWDAVAPALAKVAAYVGKQADAFVSTVNKTVAMGVGLAILAGIAIWGGILDKAEAISAVLKALHLH